MELPRGLTLIDPGQPAGGGMPAGLSLVDAGTPIDLSDPIKRAPEIRATIEKLSGPAREHALRQWADAYVAAERGGSTGIDNAARTVARGSFVGPFLDEINAAGSQVAHTVTGGRMGAPYDEAVAYQRARDRSVDENYPVMSIAGRLAGGLAGGIGAVRAGPGIASTLAGGPLANITPAATWGGRAAQGAGVGAAYGAVHGAGDAEGGLETRLEGAARGIIPGAVAGGVLSVGADSLRGLARAASNVYHPERGAYERVLSTLGNETLDQFAARIATGAGNRNQAVQERTLRILGEEMQAAGGDVARAEAATIARIRAEAGVTDATARGNIRSLTEPHRESPLMFGEAPMVAGRDAMPGRPASASQPAVEAMPATGETGARIAGRARRDPTEAEIRAVGTAEPHPLANVTDYLANNGNTTSGSMVRSAVGARQNDNIPNFLERLWRLVPGHQTTDDAAAVVANMRRMASAEYNAAYNGPIDNRVLMADLPTIINNHLNRMAGRSGEQSAALRRAIDEFFIEAPGVGRITMQSLQHLQDARQAVRGMIEEARRAGRDHIVNTLQPLYRDVTDVMSRASPAWAQANRRWADGAATERGFELGQSLSQRGSPLRREQLDEFRQMAPEAQQLARIGFVQKLDDMVSGLRDTHDVSRLFQSSAMREATRTILGPRLALQLERLVRDQSVMARTQGNLGNSRTATRLATREQMQTDPGLIAAAENLSAGGIRQWLAAAARNFLTERRDRVLADIVTTPLRDTARVSEHIANMRREQARLARYNQPRTGQLVTSATVGGMAGGAVAPRNALMGY